MGLRQHAEVMAVVQDTGLDAVPGLAVGCHRLAADVVVDSGGSHQVAFVRGIDEHLSRIAAAAQHGDRRDPLAALPHAGRTVEPLLPMDGNPVFGHQVFEHLLGDVRLEDPHRAIGAVDGRRALALVAVFVGPLPLPRARLLVVPPDPMVELPGQAADHGLVAGVGEAESTTRQAAQMRVGADHDDRLAQATRLHRGHHACRRRAVDDKVVLRRLCRRRRNRRHDQESERQESHEWHGLEFATRGVRR